MRVSECSAVIAYVVPVLVTGIQPSAIEVPC